MAAAVSSHPTAVSRPVAISEMYLPTPTCCTWPKHANTVAVEMMIVPLNPTLYMVLYHRDQQVNKIGHKEEKPVNSVMPGITNLWLTC